MEICEMALIIIVITPDYCCGRICVWCKPLYGKKKNTNNTDLDPWNCVVYCRRRGEVTVGVTWSIKQDVCLRIGLIEHTAGRDEVEVESASGT